MSVINQRTTHDDVTLAITFTAGNTVVFAAAAADDLVVFFDYTKGDETIGMEFRIRHLSQTSVAHELGIESGNIWTAIPVQKIPKPAGASVQLAVRLLRVAGAIEIAVRFGGTSSAAPGTVTVNVVSTGPRV